MYYLFYKMILFAEARRNLELGNYTSGKGKGKNKKGKGKGKNENVPKLWLVARK